METPNELVTFHRNSIWSIFALVRFESVFHSSHVTSKCGKVPLFFGKLETRNLVSEFSNGSNIFVGNCSLYGSCEVISLRNISIFVRWNNSRIFTASLIAKRMYPMCAVCRRKYWQCGTNIFYTQTDLLKNLVEWHEQTYHVPKHIVLNVFTIISPYSTYTVVFTTVPGPRGGRARLGNEQTATKKQINHFRIVCLFTSVDSND